MTAVPSRVAITTSFEPDEETVARAKAAARAYGVPFLSRGKRSLDELRGERRGAATAPDRAHRGGRIEASSAFGREGVRAGGGEGAGRGGEPNVPIAGRDGVRAGGAEGAVRGAGSNMPIAGREGVPTPGAEDATRGADGNMPIAGREGVWPPSADGAPDVVIVLGRDGVRLADAHGTVLWSPGMAALRVKRIQAGEGDTLVEVAGLKKGDRVLDCTLGFGQDAWVAAHAVGEAGRVVSLEKSLALAIFTGEGIAHAGAQPGASAIEVRHIDALAFLSRAESASFDVVLFDPMFGRPRKAQPSFETLRRHADESPLTAQMLAEAKRVARRCVVVKGARYSDDLKKLGLRAEQRSRYADVVWARIDV